MAIQVKASHPVIAKQRGVAALLLVLLTGISATVVTFGVMSHVKGAQRSQLALHGQTQAEMNAWASVNALKTFLDGNKLKNVLLTDYTFTFAGKKDVAKAQFVNACSDIAQSHYCYRVSASSADNVAALEVVFHIPWKGEMRIYDMQKRPFVVKGDLEDTGGGLDVLSRDNINVAVDGNLTITSASVSNLSGCAVGNIYVDGGGVTDNSFLYSSDGDITLVGLDAVGLDVWGGNITITGGGGHYTSIKAVNDVSASGVGNFVSDFTWANNLVVSPRGDFNNVAQFNEDLMLGNGPASLFDELRIGRDLIVVSDSHYPKLDANSIIAGDVKIGTSAGLVKPVTDITNLGKDAKLEVGVVGRPACNVETEKFDVATLMSSANYIFYIDEVSKKRMLKIQNVKNKDHVSVAGTYELEKYKDMADVPQFICGWMKNGSKCYEKPSNNQLDWSFTGIYTVPQGIVFFGGLGNPNLQRMSLTVAEFNGITQVPEASSPLFNTFLSSGTLNLTAGSAPEYRHIVAPYFADADEVCGGDFYPSNLCEKTDKGVMDFITIDKDGNRWKKESLANSAIMVNDTLVIAGWTIEGHVVVGSTLKTESNEVNVQGVVMVGVNEAKGGLADVNKGGMVTDTSKLTEDQWRLNLGIDPEKVQTDLDTPSLRWARYL